MPVVSSAFPLVSVGRTPPLCDADGKAVVVSARDSCKLELEGEGDISVALISVSAGDALGATARLTSDKLCDEKPVLSTRIICSRADLNRIGASKKVELKSKQRIPINTTAKAQRTASATFPYR